MATLVTGAAGFIGFHVARALMARGDDVIGIDNFSNYYDPRLKQDRIAQLRTANSGAFEFEQVDFANADVLDRALGKHDFDRIIHLGAQPGVRHSIENPLAYASANLAGHLNLLEVARRRQASQMVYASSSSVYGGNEALPFRVEDRTDHPISLYAATKRADELMSEAYAQLYRIPLTGLRFFTVYGPWGRPDMAVWDFTSRILEGRTIPLYNQGRMQRDFTYIDDIVDGVLSSHDHPPSDDGREKSGGSRAPHRLYNIGNNRPEELMRLVGLIEESCGRNAEVELLPMQPGDAPATYADISAIQADLGFSPRTPIDVGIPRFVEWYRAYRGGQ